MGIPYAAMPLGSALMTLHFLQAALAGAAGDGVEEAGE